MLGVLHCFCFCVVGIIEWLYILFTNKLNTPFDVDVLHVHEKVSEHEHE